MTIKNWIMKSLRGQSFCYLLIFGAGVFACFFMFWVTTKDPGVDPDTVEYFEAAQNLLAGKGLTVRSQPMTHFPPAYPMMLAFGGLFQPGNILQVSRILAAFFFGANLVLLGIAILLCTDRCFTAVGAILCVFLTSAPVIRIHAMAWSEAPFITFSLAAFILLSLYLNKLRFYLLLLTAICVGWAIAIRYVGVALLPPFALALLIFGNRPFKQKIKDVFIAIPLALLPVGFWMIRNILLVGTATNRTFAIHLIGQNHIKQLIDTIFGFALPIAMPGYIFTKALQLGVAAVLVIASFEILRRKNYLKNNANTFGIIFPTICVLFFVTYISFLVISISFFDAATPLKVRILLPAFLIISLPVISLCWSLSSALKNRTIWSGFLIMASLFAINNIDKAITTTMDIHNNGLVYTSLPWKNSETMGWLKSLPKDIKIYTNGEDAIRFHLGIQTNKLPRTSELTSLAPNVHFESQVQTICKEVGEGRAVIVYFNEITWNLNYPTVKDLLAKCPMPALANLTDGDIIGNQPDLLSTQGVSDFSEP